MQKKPLRKISKKDEINLVSIGQLPYNSGPHTISIWQLLEIFEKEKIHVHIYSKVDKQTELKFKELKNKYLHFHGYVPREKLMQEITKYDYGIYLTPWNRSKKPNFANETVFGYRIFDYFCAKLPVLNSNDAKPVALLINEYNIGYNINYMVLLSLRKFLKEKKKEYHVLVKNTEKVIKVFSDNKNFVEFIKK